MPTGNQESPFARDLPNPRRDSNPINGSVDIHNAILKRDLEVNCNRRASGRFLFLIIETNSPACQNCIRISNKSKNKQKKSSNKPPHTTPVRSNSFNGNQLSQSIQGSFYTPAELNNYNPSLPIPLLHYTSIIKPKIQTDN